MVLSVPLRKDSLRIISLSVGYHSEENQGHVSDIVISRDFWKRRESLLCVALTWDCPDVEYSTAHAGLISYCFDFFYYIAIIVVFNYDMLIGNWIKRKKRKWVVHK